MGLDSNTGGTKTYMHPTDPDPQHWYQLIQELLTCGWWRARPLRRPAGGRRPASDRPARSAAEPGSCSPETEFTKVIMTKGSCSPETEFTKVILTQGSGSPETEFTKVILSKVSDF
jgi:hypothetical protein